MPPPTASPDPGRRKAWTAYFVARAEQIPDGAKLAVRIGRREIAVFRIKDEFFALPNRCSHKGGPLCEGDLIPDRKVIRCPWHLWNWNLETGCLEAYPQHRVNPVTVKVVDGEVRLYMRDSSVSEDAPAAHGDEA